MQVRGQLSRESILEFLEETTVPVRLGCRTPADHPWLCSVWYRPVDEAGEPGPSADDWRLECATAASADLVTFLEHDPELAFEVSTNDPPYAGVRGRGTAAIEPDPEKEALRTLLERYLGGTDSPLARNLLDEDREEVRIEIDPAVVYGWDFAARMRDAT